MEKDLSIHVDNKLWLGDHAEIAVTVAKVNKILGLYEGHMNILMQFLWKACIPVLYNPI